MKETVKELFIDVSEYEPPQPFEEVIQLLKQMKSGEYIRMLHRKKPVPLLQLLQENGFNFIVLNDKTTGKEKSVSHQSRVRDDSLWEIIIWRKDDSLVDDYCANEF